MQVKSLLLLKLFIFIFAVVFVQSCSTGKHLQREPMEKKFAEGMNAFEQKSYIKAKDIFSDLVYDKSNDPRYREMLGFSLVRLGQMREGRSIIESVLREYPNRKYALMAMSEIYLREGDMENHIAILEKIVSIYPYDMTAYKAITMHYWKQENLKESTKWVELALKNKPDDQWAQNMLSEINKAKKKSTIDVSQMKVDNILTASELKFLHKKYKIENKVSWNRISVVQKWPPDKKINRRNFLRYMTDIFYIYLGSGNFHKSFADTETTIKDLQKNDTDYSKVLYFIARDLSFEYINGKILLDKIVSEDEAIEFLVRIREQLSL